MSEAKYDMVALGNAIVDVLAKASDKFIERQVKEYGMHKGAMSLIDEQRAIELYSLLDEPVETSGGSAANTMAGFASFGGNGCFIGKVADDELGKAFRKDIREIGVFYETTPLIVGAPTARCIILVSPDGERTMNTFLGASVELSPTDIDANLIASSQITYLEGYLYDEPRAKEAFKIAAEIAHNAGHRVALTLSDPFCVERHREDFQYLVAEHVDILFANEHEIVSLYETDTFEQAAKQVIDKCEIAALTRSAKGSVVMTKSEMIEMPAEKVDAVIDTTGAGDQYAAGFLYGFTRGMSVEMCARLGTLAATEVITHIGPRPLISYRNLIEKAKAA